MSSPKIAFFQQGGFSQANKNIAALLQAQFPENAVEIFDFKSDFINISSGIAAVWHYGFDILSGKKALRECMERNPVVFRRIKKHAAELLSKGEYLFSIQTQSLFDASVPGTPHFVYTDHCHRANMLYPEFPPEALFKKWLPLERSIYQNAHITFTMGSNIAKTLREDYGIDEGQIACVGVGNNIPSFTHLHPPQYQNKRILFVGLDWERKGGKSLVEAFEQVLKTIPDAKLTVIGCLPEVATPNVDTHAFVPKDEIGKYFAEASVYCMPSKREPFGIVFIDALANQLPIVGPNVGGVVDIIHEGKNGYQVAPDDTAAIADALIKLLGDPEKCKAFGMYGYNLWREKYTWESTVDRMAGHIRRSLNMV